MDIKKINTTGLAYIGDAVYEVYVREGLLKENVSNIDAIHKMATKFVRAESQALVVKTIFDNLTEQEQALVKRARNHKISSKPKNADPVTYKLATAFEALVGYLYLTDDKDRLSEILSVAVKIIRDEAKDVKRQQEKEECKK